MRIPVLPLITSLALPAFLLSTLAFTHFTQARAVDSDNAPLPANTPVFDTIVVSGLQPGPGLWKVSKGEHVMWVLGSLTPVPRRMVWQSQSVEAVIAKSQEVLMSPGAEVSSDAGFFGSLFLLPSLMGVRKNPDKQTLKDIVPADLYARWLTLKKKYLGRNSAVEKRRPIFAADALYAEAIEDSGLSQRGIVNKMVRKAAKRHNVPIIEPMVKIKIKDPKGMIKDFKQASLDDIECFTKTLQHLESDLETMKDRANAWAVGDIALLQELSYTDQGKACINAVMEMSVVQGAGLDKLPAQLRAEWIKAAEAALSKNKQTFAALPMNELVDSDGCLAALREKGYTVEAPTK
jgi:uncharacterized protein YbaP (TraB family)